MAMEAEHENRVKAMEKKNIELMRKLDDDRDRLGKSAEALKQAEIKYAKIQQILDDERRASQMSQAQLHKLAEDFENERRQSSAFEADAQRKL
jgi:L-fucose isomerase-like protein